jgi:hypothetical protein
MSGEAMYGLGQFGGDMSFCSRLYLSVFCAKGLVRFGIALQS